MPYKIAPYYECISIYDLIHLNQRGTFMKKDKIKEASEALLEKSIDLQLKKLTEAAMLKADPDAVILLSLLQFMCTNKRKATVAVSQEALDKYGLLTKEGDLISPYICDILQQKEKEPPKGSWLRKIFRF